VRRKAVAQNELDVAEAQLGRAEGEVARLQGTLERQKLQLSYTEITAPFAGTAGLSAVDVGALVGPDSGPLTTLTLLDPIEVTFPVATALVLDYHEAVASGAASRLATVHLTLPNGVLYPIAGDLDYISADVAQGTDTVTVRATFQNPDGVLLDGALVGVSLEQREPEQRLTVPQQAVQRDQAGTFVLVVGDDGKVELRRVTVARVERGRAIVTDGLAEGENVITEGVNKVRPGIVVDAAVGG
jgi:membrane fusion protein (multidrug efflux system)